MSESIWDALQAGVAPDPELEALAALAALGVRYREVASLVAEEPWELDDVDELPQRVAAATEDWPLPATFSGGDHVVVLGVSFAGEPYAQLIRGGPLSVRLGAATYVLTPTVRVVVALDGVPPADRLVAVMPDGAMILLLRQ